LPCPTKIFLEALPQAARRSLFLCRCEIYSRSVSLNTVDVIEHFTPQRKFAAVKFNIPEAEAVDRFQ
jgi:hypothetical protein